MKERVLHIDRNNELVKALQRDKGVVNSQYVTITTIGIQTLVHPKEHCSWGKGTSGSAISGLSGVPARVRFSTTGSLRLQCRGFFTSMSMEVLRCELLRPPFLDFDNVVLQVFNRALKASQTTEKRCVQQIPTRAKLTRLKDSQEHHRSAESPD